MNKTIRLAEIPVEIITLYDSVANTEDYETKQTPAFSVCISEQDITNERQISINEYAHEGKPYPDFSPAELENTAVYRKIADKLPEYDGMVFHGSAVAIGNRAYLFTAKSGTGKTTHTNLWLKNIEGSYIVNGDKPIIRLIDGKPCVCGTPWMGKEKQGCNKVVPLGAICFLNRGKENKIEKTDFLSVYPRFLSQAYRPEKGEMIKKTIKLLEKIAEAVPFYELYCNTENEAALVSFRGMTDEQI